MGVSDPELRKKLFEPRWVQHNHEVEKQGWPWWKRLLHRMESCPLCRPENEQGNKPETDTQERR